MAFSKIIFNGTTQIDLTQDTVATDNLLTNYTAHDSGGNAIVGTATGGATPTLQTITKTYTPTESQQTETITAGSGYDGIEEVDVTVNAISSSYVGSGVARKSSTDLTASGATVTAPAGYYASDATKTIPNANPYISATTEFVTSDNKRVFRYQPFVEVDSNEGDTPGYMADGTHLNGNVIEYPAVLANTTITPTTSSQTIGGAKYMMEGAVTVSAMPSGTAGTPTATKGTVSNHQVSVTPSVTNTTGYITGSTKTGTAVTVTASELVSGSETKTANGTYDVTNLASLVVAVPFVTYYTGTSDPASSLGQANDIYLKTVS